MLVNNTANNKEFNISIDLADKDKFLKLEKNKSTKPSKQIFLELTYKLYILTPLIYAVKLSNLINSKTANKVEKAYIKAMLAAKAKQK